MSRRRSGTGRSALGGGSVRSKDRTDAEDVSAPGSARPRGDHRGGVPRRADDANRPGRRRGRSEHDRRRVPGGDGRPLPARLHAQVRAQAWSRHRHPGRAARRPLVGRGRWPGAGVAGRPAVVALRGPARRGDRGRHLRGVRRGPREAGPGRPRPGPLRAVRRGSCRPGAPCRPYAAETPTIARLHAAIEAAGLRARGRHHEIYIGDPRRSAPDRLRTILRQPVG